MTLAGAQIAQRSDALLAAYPRRDTLRMMMRVELGENLDAIASGDTLRDAGETSSLRCVLRVSCCVLRRLPQSTASRNTQQM